mmetsp:Transcript_19961/g.36950  ORF Transcript_19961/g.36950 Transcript_19961/m.36950 type:complete len:85 (-) Transcript_19961:1384-1638(-)
MSLLIDMLSCSKLSNCLAIAARVSSEGLRECKSSTDFFCVLNVKTFSDCTRECKVVVENRDFEKVCLNSLTEGDFMWEKEVKEA